MPLKDSFQKLLNKASDQIEQRIGGKPPPVPHASKPQHPSHPSATHAPAVYWAPNFDPSVPVSQHFEYNTGQTGWGNNEAQNYTSDPTNAFFTPEGQLVIRAVAKHKAPTQEEKFTSARLLSHQRLARPAGCLTFRVTSPSAKGIWPALWLLPVEPCTWPTDGEIDIFESWNADPTNHSCLHWGLYNAEDAMKHRVQDTPIPGLKKSKGEEYAFAWQQGHNGQGGKLVWWINGKAVMKAEIPHGIRPMADFQLIINIAMGGDVCEGQLPKDGTYDFVIHELKMLDTPPHGWHGFEADWHAAREGHAM